MNLPPGVLDVVKKMAPWLPSAEQWSDTTRRVWCRKVAEQVTFNFGPRWGGKSASPTRPFSKDAIAYQADNGRLWGFDLVNGTTHKVNDPCVGIDITGQFFIPVVGVNHLGAAPPAPPAPEPPPVVVPATENAAILANILSALDEQGKRVAALEQRLASAVSRLTLIEGEEAHRRITELEQARYRVEARSTTTWGHQHYLRADVVKVK
jgi:hypothetical protein